MAEVRRVCVSKELLKEKRREKRESRGWKGKEVDRRELVDSQVICGTTNFSFPFLTNFFVSG